MRRNGERTIVLYCITLSSITKSEPDRQIEHPVPNFDAWKKAFDSDPANRKQSGVRRYRVFRPIDNPNYAIIELEFDSLDKAEGLLAAMREVWRGVQGSIIGSPQARIVEAVESKEL